MGGIGLLSLMLVGVIGTLWLAGVSLNPFASVVTEDPFMVRIPINSLPIPAYTRVDRTQMMNPATGGLMFQNVPPTSAIGMSILGVDQHGSHVDDRIENVMNVNDEVVFLLSGNREVRQSQTFELGGAMLNVNSIIGRVVKRDKRVGMGFQESTFFPQGTPEGIAGATPKGMRTITLDATKLTGVHALGLGDHVDLMASFPMDETASESSLLGTAEPPATGGQDEPHLLAQNAIVLKPVYVRNEASTSASLTQGTRVQNLPKYEVAIAVNPDDLIPLQRALNQQVSITCIAHSMKPRVEAEGALVSADIDTVSVPVTVRAVLAYNVVTRVAFVSPATRALKMESMSRSQVERMDIITSLDEALGAIAKHDIPAGRFLRRSDLMSGPPSREPAPQQLDVQLGPSSARGVNANGTVLVSMLQSDGHQHGATAAPVADTASSATAVGDRPAITRFVPPGRTAFAIPWNRVYGSEHLQIGDEIDLMASYSLESNDSLEETETRSDGTVIVRTTESLDIRETRRTWGESFGFRAEPWFVASDAIVVAPVGFPAPASALRVLGDELTRPTSGNSDGTGLSGPPVIIAVDDRDVEAVTAALATREALFTIAFHANAEVAGSLSSDSKQIVVASEALSPFEEFNESIWLGNRRHITTRVVSKADGRFEHAISLDDVRFYYGRVLAHAKTRGDFLTASDFLPPGAKPGLGAGVPTGHTFLPVSDREIEGLDSFSENDHVAILVRGIAVPIEGVVTTGADYSRPVSSVVIGDARIARASIAGQTVLSIVNEDLTAVQAAIAGASTGGSNSDRPQLIAVVRPRASAPPATASNTDAIPAFDPFSQVRYTETIVGGHRSVQAFAGASR